MAATLAVLASGVMTTTALYRSGPGFGIVPHSDALEVSIYGLDLGCVPSLCITYLLRGRGKGLASASFICGVTYVLTLLVNACMILNGMMRVDP